MEELPDDLLRTIAKKLTTRESQHLSATGSELRRVITKNLAKQISIKKRIKKDKEDLKEHINEYYLLHLNNYY